MIRGYHYFWKHLYLDLNIWVISELLDKSQFLWISFEINLAFEFFSFFERSLLNCIFWGLQIRLTLYHPLTNSCKRWRGVIQIELEPVEQGSSRFCLQKFSDLGISAKTICSSSILHSVFFFGSFNKRFNKGEKGQSAGVLMNCMAYERLTYIVVQGATAS